MFGISSDRPSQRKLKTPSKNIINISHDFQVVLDLYRSFMIKKNIDLYLFSAFPHKLFSRIIPNCRNSQNPTNFINGYFVSSVSIVYVFMRCSFKKFKAELKTFIPDICFPFADFNINCLFVDYIIQKEKESCKSINHNSLLIINFSCKQPTNFLQSFL